MQRLVAYATCMYSCLSKISFAIQIFNFGYLSSGHTILTSERIWGYVVIFRNQKGSVSKKNLGKATLENRISYSLLHTPDFIKVSILL